MPASQSETSMAASEADGLHPVFAAWEDEFRGLLPNFPLPKCYNLRIVDV